MAKRIRVALIGAKPLTAGPGSGQLAVDHMIAHWQAKVEKVLPDRPDLIVVPECCDRYLGWSLGQLEAYYVARGDQVRDAFAAVAQQQRCYVAYAAIRRAQDDTWRNSIQLLDRQGQVAGVYDKNYPTISEMEGLGICPGTTAPIIECDFGRVACAICFDLNFDELRLQYAQQAPDLIVFASMYHGGLMQPYWAYSCRTHLVSAIAGLPSQAIDPLGRTVASSTNYFDWVTTTLNLDCRLAHLDYHWEKLEALKRAYGPEVSIVDPGFLGSVLVTSETVERSAVEMLREFEIEPLDDYFERAKVARRMHLSSCGGSG